MADEDLVELCYGECAACCFDLDHQMVTREQRDKAIAYYSGYLARRNTPEYKAEQEELTKTLQAALDQMKAEKDKENGD